MNTNDMNARIEAILADRVNFEILHRPGTLPATRRSYAFWWVSMMDAKKESFEHARAKNNARRAADGSVEQALARRELRKTQEGHNKYLIAKRKLRKLLDALTNESCAQVMREGIARNPSGE